MVGMLRREAIVFCQQFSLRECCPPSLALMPDTSVPPCMPWCLSSCCPCTRVKQEWVWISLCVGPLIGTAWESSSLFHWLHLYWFLQPVTTETYLPNTRTLGWGSWCGAPEISLLIFIHHTWVWDQPIPHLHVSAPPTSLDGCGFFFNSVDAGPPFNSISASSEWCSIFSCDFDVVVRGDKPYLPMLTSWRPFNQT